MHAPLNPYESPQDAHEPPQIDPRQQLRARLGVPSLGLLVVSWTGFAVWMLLLVGWVAAALPHLGSGVGDAEEILGVGVVVTGGFALLHAIMGIVAGRMRRLESLGVCRVAALFACVPLLSPGFIFGIPFGLWAIVVLCWPGTAAQFDQVVPSKIAE